MAKHSITESFQISGEWFLPGTKVQIPGILSWESERAYLHLNDSFTPLNGAVHPGESQTYSAIHGVTTDSRHFSVLQAMRAQAQINIGAAGIRQPEKLYSNWIVSGAHVSHDTLYNEIRVRIPGLQIWLSRSGVTQTIIEKGADYHSSVVYQIERLPEETFRIPTIEATLGWGIDRIFSGNMISDIAVKTSAGLRINPDQPKSLDWLLHEVGKATTLLSFMAGSPMSPDSIEATLSDGITKAEILVVLREARYCAHKQPRDFYMLRGAMGIDFAKVFTKWFEIYDSIEMPAQLALSVLSSEKLWLHIEFLSLMHALEGFHRATMQGLYTLPLEYEKIRHSLSNAIPKDVGQDHRAALKKRIEYGNEISLRKRLSSIVERLELPLRKFILGGNGGVPSSWVETRNYYTHWDEASRMRVLDGTGMHQADVRMRHLLRALYLALVEIPQSAIAKSLSNASSECQYLVQLNNMDHRKNNPNDDSGAIMYIHKSQATSSSYEPS